MPQLSVRVRGACGPWGPCGPWGVWPPVVPSAFAASPFSSSGSVPFAAVFPMATGRVGTDQRRSAAAASPVLSVCPSGSAQRSAALCVCPRHATLGYCTAGGHPTSTTGRQRVLTPSAASQPERPPVTERASRPDPPTCADTTWPLRGRTGTLPPPPAAGPGGGGGGARARRGR